MKIRRLEGDHYSQRNAFTKPHQDKTDDVSRRGLRAIQGETELVLMDAGEHYCTTYVLRIDKSQAERSSSDNGKRVKD